MNSYINLILDAEGAKARLRRLFESAPEPEIARKSILRKWWSNVQLCQGLKVGLSGVFAHYLANGKNRPRTSKFRGLGETINIMTLGGLALAVGILVDDATVTIEISSAFWKRVVRCTMASWKALPRSRFRRLNRNISLQANIMSRAGIFALNDEDRRKRGAISKANWKSLIDEPRVFGNGPRRGTLLPGLGAHNFGRFRRCVHESAFIFS